MPLSQLSIGWDRAAQPAAEPGNTSEIIRNQNRELMLKIFYRKFAHLRAIACSPISPKAFQ